MDERDHRPDNPYTAMEGYAVLDASGAEIGRVQDTVYDAVSDVLKYVVVDRRPVPAERIDVDAEAERVTVSYAAAAIRSAPEMQDPSGDFDDAVREHYGEPG